MTSTALGDLMLAEQVALPRPETWGDHCPAWIESAGRKCGKDRTHGYLCARHHAVALHRYQQLRRLITT